MILKGDFHDDSKPGEFPNGPKEGGYLDQAYDQNYSTKIIDRVFEMDVQDQFNVASFVKDITKCGYSPLFYTNIGTLAERVPIGSNFKSNSIKDKGSTELDENGEPVMLQAGPAKGFFLGHRDTPVQN